jgi:hypothetical protein
VCLREAVREAWRDVVSGVGRAGTCALVLAVLLVAVVGTRVVAVVEDVRAAATWVASGAATAVEQADGRVDGRACTALGEVDGVLGAGALRRLEEGTTVLALPGTAVPTYEASPSIAGVLAIDGGAGSSGVWVSAEVAEELGVSAGATLATSDGPVPVAGVYAWPDDGRDPDLAYALVAPVPVDDEPFDQCQATVWPQDPSVGALLRGTVLPSAGEQDESRPTSGQLNPRLGVTFMSDGRADAVLLAAAAAGASGLVVGAVAVFRRRLSLASDRHVGVPVAHQVVGAVAQHAVWGVVAAMVTVAVAAVLCRGLPTGDAGPVVTEVVVLAGLAVVGAVLGAAAGVLSVRERALHRYFRSR